MSNERSNSSGGSQDDRRQPSSLHFPRNSREASLFRFSSGEHRGKTVGEVAKLDVAYLNRLADLSTDGVPERSARMFLQNATANRLRPDQPGDMSKPHAKKQKQEDVFADIFPRNADEAGSFQFRFGKHKNLTVKEIAVIDIGYLRYQARRPGDGLPERAARVFLGWPASSSRK